MFNLPSIDPAVTLIFRLVLAYVFAGAAWHKLHEPRSFHAAVGDYRMLPGIFVTPVAVGLVVAECMTVIMLLVPPTALIGTQIAGGLLLMYTVAILFNLARGRTDIDCGCMMGPARTLNGWLLARNLPLVLVALVAGLQEQSRNLVAWDFITVICAVTALVMLYSSANLLLANGSRLRALMVHHD